MKKLRLLLFATLVAGSANAQYFQHVYGAQSQDVLESGVNWTIPLGVQNHLMTGYTDRMGFHTPEVVRTDMNGRILGPPSFNNLYVLNGSADAKGRRIVQVTGGGGRIGIWGDFNPAAGGVSNSFFYMMLNPNGTPGFAMSYTFNVPVAEVEATSICNSAVNPGTVFVCGYVRLVAGGTRYPVVMRINGLTGAFAWGFRYSVPNIVPDIDWTANDIVESPYNSVTEVALCGAFVRPGFPSNACFFRVNEATGAIVPFVVSYGTASSNNVLNAIDVARNPFGSGQGFIMGGSDDASGQLDSWAIKVSPNGMVVDFSTVHDYMPNSGNDYCNDIIERQNTAGAFEYYMGGCAINGIFGGSDALVYKIDFAGAPVPGGQFSFGGPGDEDARQLDQYDIFNPAMNNGLSTFGNTANSFGPLGQNDFYFVKSYFNGITQCNFDIQTHNAVAGPGMLETWQAITNNKFIQTGMQIQLVPMQDFEVCWNPGPIGGGSNARMNSSTQQLLEPGYFPNPVSHDNAVVTVNFGKAAVEGEAQIELWNALGQLCWSRNASVADGQTQMEIQLGNELSGGMYHLIVKQNGTVSNYRIVVQ